MYTYLTVRKLKPKDKSNY